MIRFRSRILAATAAIAVLAALPLTIALASIDGTCSIQMQVNDRRTVGLTKSVNIGISPTSSVTFTDGAGASSANQLYQASRTMSGGADSLDLNGTAIKDGYGDNVALARVKAIYIKNTSTHTETFGGGSNPWTTLINPIAGTGTPEAGLVLPPGAFVLIVSPDATGWTVTATTGDLLNSTGTTTDTYDIAILGAKT